MNWACRQRERAGAQRGDPRTALGRLTHAIEHPLFRLVRRLPARHQHRIGCVEGGRRPGRSQTETQLAASHGRRIAVSADADFVQLGAVGPSSYRENLEGEHEVEHLDPVRKHGCHDMHSVIVWPGICGDSKRAAPLHELIG
ncbi:hypothetical protein ACFYV7_35905 [Nocardia suismassiliense]|uniref:Uncharacterized protein n=1 Tax=Nocardia suismassiliense TaxID=2077092 RepID=A0ABW6R3Y3_9NOCA